MEVPFPVVRPYQQYQQMTKTNHLKKRSFSIAGHRTSIALEPEFWAVLGEAARTQGIALAALVARIDAARNERALASALRLYALERAAAKTNI